MIFYTFVLVKYHMYLQFLHPFWVDSIVYILFVFLYIEKFDVWLMPDVWHVFIETILKLYSTPIIIDYIYISWSVFLWKLNSFWAVLLSPLFKINWLKIGNSTGKIPFNQPINQSIYTFGDLELDNTYSIDS